MVASRSVVMMERLYLFVGQFVEKMKITNGEDANWSCKNGLKEGMERLTCMASNESWQFKIA